MRVGPYHYGVPDALTFGDPPNDNQAPLGLAPGEAYLERVYQAVTSNPDRWSRTVLIVSYDEHGGFYDHAGPPAIRPLTGAAARTTGVRVPAIVISPFVEPGTVFSGLLDHTAILQLLAERFAPGGASDSDAVAFRRRQGSGSLSAVFNRSDPRSDVPEAPPPPLAAATPAGVAARPSVNETAFLRGARQLHDEPGAAASHPELAAWDGGHPARPA